MKRCLLALLVTLALPLAAAEKWYEAYDRGVAAVNAKNYRIAAEALQRAIAETPNEGTGVRAKNSLITYVPHFWLGIAKFHLGDNDGALREWRISEEQGVIARTDYYARMKDWVARAQLEKQRNARDAASASKKAADTAISKALESQLDALSAGGDRADSYLTAQRKLQDARTQFQKAGTDVSAYRNAEQTATQASSLFAAAIEEGKKLRAARAATPAPKKQLPPPPPQRVVAQMLPTPAASAPAPAVAAASAIPIRTTPPPAATQPVAPAASPAKRPVAASALPPANRSASALPPAKKPVVEMSGEAAVSMETPIVSAAEADRQIAQQQAKRRQVEPASSLDLRPAYRAFARGDVAASERLLTQILATHRSAEALLLRGCARYTRAMLSRDRDPWLAAATSDFQAALSEDGSLRLDRNAFSPKLIAFFETVRKQR